MIRILFCIILSLTFNSSVLCQKEANLTSAEESIKLLKSGALLVRLYMNKPKSDLMESNIKNSGVDEVKRQKIKKLLEEHNEERHEYKLKTISSFQKNYDFSKVFFIHDYDYKKFLNGEKGLLLSAEGAYDKSLSIDSIYYLAIRGNSDDVVIISQKNGDAMPKGFPDKYNRNVLAGIFAIVDNKDNLSDYISKLNTKLKKYYYKVMFQ